MTIDIEAIDALLEKGANCPSADMAAQYIVEVFKLAPALRDEVRELREENEFSHDLIMRQGRLLTGVVNALRGDPEPLTAHSHHDAPELAAALKAENAALRARVAVLEEALRPFSLLPVEAFGQSRRHPDVPVFAMNDIAVTATDVLVARAALTPEKPR